MATLPNNRDVWRIAAPMMLSNISVPLLGMVDTGVTGHLENADYLAAVAIGSTIFAFIYAGFNFLRMGTTGITAQKFGAEDNDGLKVALGQALIVSLTIAMVLIILQVPIGDLSMRMLGAKGSVANHAYQYFNIRIWSAPATLANYALVGWFLGLQNARVPLFIVLVINVTNIVLDLFFVLVLDMKVAGVAAASVVAEFSGLAFGGVYALRYLRRHPGQMLFAHLTTLQEYRAFFAVNAHLLVRTMALIFSYAFVTAAGARIGPMILAANAVLMNLMNLMSFALDGFAHAAEALVGKAVGARNREALREAVRLTLRWSLYMSLMFCIFFFIGGPSLIRLLTDIPEVIAVADRYLPWMTLMPLVAVWSYLYDGVFVGATRAREMRDIMLVSTFLVFLPTWYATRELGNHGLWLALATFLASRGIGMHYYYRTRVLEAVSPASTSP
ncbi:MAG: MATE family efflux transporter [Woeseiaceae bacterium]